VFLKVLLKARINKWLLIWDKQNLFIYLLTEGLNTGYPVVSKKCVK